MKSSKKDTAIAWIITIGCIVLVAVFAVWWHRERLLGPETEKIEVEPVKSEELNNTILALLQYNGYDTEEVNLDTINPTVSAKELSDNLTDLVNNVSSTHAVVVPIVSQNLLFTPAPSIVWLKDERTIRPVLFVSANESEVTYYDPTSGEQTTLGFSSFHKMYDEAERQCVYIAPRGYEGYQ